MPCHILLFYILCLCADTICVVWCVFAYDEYNRTGANWIHFWQAKMQRILAHAMYGSNKHFPFTAYIVVLSQLMAFILYERWSTIQLNSKSQCRKEPTWIQLVCCFKRWHRTSPPGSWPIFFLFVFDYRYQHHNFNSIK